MTIIQKLPRLRFSGEYQFASESGIDSTTAE